MSGKNGNYLAVIGDLVGSRAMAAGERRDVQQRFQATLDKVNAEFRDEIAALFLITAGDETQGLLTRPDCCYEILRLIQIELTPYEIVFGVGWGALATDIGEYAVGADGRAFHLARQALEEAKQERKAYGKSILREVRFHSDGVLQDGVLDALFLALAVLKHGWTSKQARVLHLLERGRTPKDVAEVLDVPPSNISRTADAAHFREFELLADCLRSVLRQSF